MKRTIIASLIGGVILFTWQFLSWNVANLHTPAQKHTPQQAQIMEALNSFNLEEGGYIMPMPAPGTTTAEWDQLMAASAGKPWAKLEYHNALTNNIALNIARGLIIDVLTVLLFCWVISRCRQPSFRTILAASLATGLIVFFNAPYTNFIWYEGFDIWGHLADAVLGWGLCGLWLGWNLRQNGKAALSHTWTHKRATAHID